MRIALSLVVALVVALIVLDIYAVSKFSGQKWRLPSHVYARSLEMYAGAHLSQSDLVWELEALGYRSVRAVERAGQFKVSRDGVLIATRGFDFSDSSEMPRQVQVRFSSGQIAALDVTEGAKAPVVRLEPLRVGGIYPDHLEDRRPVALSAVPDLMVEALIAVEDRNFYSHWGVSLRGIARAIKADIAAGELVQGGSTITQQLVKNFYLTNERTVWRKLRELAIAPLLELHFSKAEILETYLNEVYFGQSGKRSIRGIGMASHFYYGMPLDELDVHQIAMLVGIVKGPSYYDPWRRPEVSKARRDLVLDIMHAQGLLTDSQRAHFKSKSLDVWDRPARALNPYPAFMRLVRDQVVEVYDQSEIKNQGFNIYTHLDPLVQNKLERTVHNELAAIEKERGLKADTLQASAVITRVGSSELVAVVGDRHPGFDGFNRVVDARRSIGSLVKPLLYVLALQQQDKTLTSMLSDAPLSVSAPNQEQWAPRNYDLKSHGEVTLLDALVHSYNQATARLGLEVGPDKLIESIGQLGVETRWQPYPAILLGAGELTPLEISELYQVLANDGFRVPLNVIETVHSLDQQSLSRFRASPEQVIDSDAVHIIQYAMQMVMLEGTGRSAFKWLERSRSVAGKTGTTDDQRDSWFAGFGGEYLGVFWVGRDDNQSTPLTGSSGALRLWANLMAEIERRPIDFVEPKNVEYMWVNRQDGKRSKANCEHAVLMPFARGTEPKQRDACARRVVPRVVDWFKGILEIAK